MSFWCFSLGKSVQVFLPFIFTYLFFGCYNNSHIRTQRVLQEDEKVFSISSYYNAVGIIDERRVFWLPADNNKRYDNFVEPYAPVAAIGAEISLLKGYKHGELGCYIGGGVNAMVDDGIISLIGAEYNKYLQQQQKNH